MVPERVLEEVFRRAPRPVLAISKSRSLPTVRKVLITWSNGLVTFSSVHEPRVPLCRLTGWLARIRRTAVSGDRIVASDDSSRRCAREVVSLDQQPDDRAVALQPRVSQ